MPVAGFPHPLPEDPAGLLLSVRYPSFRAVLPALSLAPKLSSPFLPEAADLLGAQRLSSYAAGAGVMAAVRGAAAETKRSAPSARARRPEGTRASTPPLGTSRPARLPGNRETYRARGQELAHPTPGPFSLPGSPAGSATRRGRESVCLGPGAWHPARRGEGFGGIGTPARHLPSSLSSTIISGAPCPAAARFGRRKGADSGRASARRPVLRQQAGSNYPLVRLLT